MFSKIVNRDFHLAGIIALICLVWVAGVTSCSLASQPTISIPTDTPALRSQSVTSIVVNSPTLTPQPTSLQGEIVSQIPAFDETRTPTRPPDRTPTPPELPLEQNLPIVRDGTPLPDDLAVINPENLIQLSELARWGKGEILTLAYSPDGSQVAAVTSQRVYFYSSESYDLVRFVPMKGISEPFAFSPSLRYLAKGDQNGIVMIWDLQTGEVYRSLQAEDNPINAVAFTPNESQLYASDFIINSPQDEKTYIWDLQTGRLVEIRPFGTEVFVFSSDGKTWVTKHDSRILVWRDSDPTQPQQVLSTVYDYDSPLALSMNGELLAVGNNEAWEMHIDIWQLSDGGLQKTLFMQDDQGDTAGSVQNFFGKLQALAPKSPVFRSGPGGYWIKSLAFSQDGRKLAALNAFGLLHQWRLEDSKLLSITHTDNDSVIYSPRGDVLATWQYTVSFYQAQNNQLIYILGNHTSSTSDLEFAPDGHSLAAASLDGKVWWRRARDGEIIRIFKALSTNAKDPFTVIYDIDFARDGSSIAAGASHGLSYLWSTTSSESRVFESQCPAGKGINVVSLSYDNQYLALQQTECEIEIINLKDNTIQTITNQYGYIHHPLAFSPVVPWLAVSAERGIEIFSFPDPVSIARIGNLETGQTPLLISNDGKLLATADGEGRYEVWNVNDRSLVAHFEIPPEIYENGSRGVWTVSRFAISPTNQILAVSFGIKLIFYDLSTGHELGILWSEGEAFDFSPDGRLFAVGGDDGVVYIYGIPVNQQ